MGTRADFYVGRGEEAEWLGSIAMDGYPDPPGCPHALFEPTAPANESDYRARVETILSNVKHATRPADGWPWPWEDSRTTDYAYAWDDGVKLARFGRCWHDSLEAERLATRDGDRKQCVFPNMEDRQSVTIGKRSGLITFTVGGD